MARIPTAPEPDCRLECAILAAFEQAYAAGQRDIAEHLLRALECLSRTAGQGRALKEAYGIICRDSSAEKGPGPAHRRSKTRRT